MPDPIVTGPGGIGGTGSGGSTGGQNTNYSIFIFRPCCEGPDITLKSNGVPLISGKTYQYDSAGAYTPAAGLLDGYCYTVFSQIITDQTVYNSLLNTPPANYFSDQGTEACESDKCPDCEDFPVAKTFRFRRCCDPNDIVLYNMFEYTEEPIAEGVYYYAGNYINSECYILEEVEGPVLETVHTYITFNELQLQTDCNTSLCKETCPDPECYTLVNCFEDVSINVQFTPGTVVNNGEVISINLEPGSTITREVNEYYLCGNMNLSTVGGGSVSVEFNQLAPSTQLYNGKPFYTLNYTYSGTEIINYIIWSGTQWEVWKDFDIITGPSCLDCLCNEPYLELTYSSGTVPANLPAPLVNILDDVSGTYSAFTTIACHNAFSNPGTPGGFRSLNYCPGVITTVLPDNNCWKVTVCNVVTELTIDNQLITQSLSQQLDENTLSGAGLTREETVGNYFISHTNLNTYPLIIDFVNVLNATEPIIYNWEITHKSFFFSDVVIVDPAVQHPELVKEGTAIGDFGLIRIKLTVTDAEGCSAEIIILSYAIA